LTILFDPKKEELKGSTTRVKPLLCRGVAGTKASVERTLKAVVADSIARTAERWLFKIIMFFAFFPSFFNVELDFVLSQCNKNDVQYFV
jgi:hypothetical protein